MSYVIKAVLSNPLHPEHGQITIPFPIPDSQYDPIIEKLQAMDLGFSINRDCMVNEVDSHYGVLDALGDTLVNIDQLDYLAKRLDSFCESEAAQFQAMAHKLELAHIKDFINLTFCCQRATVISDFSKLEEAGREHRMNLNGGSMPSEEYKAVDGRKEALQLIEGGGGTITPYGVVYDNGMVLEQLYNGRQFPAYLYDNSPMVLEVTSKQGLADEKIHEYLYLPASARQIERTLLRAGVRNDSDLQIRLEFHELLDQTAFAADLEHLLEGADLPQWNRMCQAVKPLRDPERKKLEAAAMMAMPHGPDEVRRLAENLDQFDFVPDVTTPEEYGRHMIRESGHFEYDPDLEGFYNFQDYGLQKAEKEQGRFNILGYIAYHGPLTLEELLREDPAEQYQQEQGPQMGGPV